MKSQRPSECDVKCVLISVTLLFVLLTMVIVGLAFVFSSRADSLFRVCVYASGDLVLPPGSGQMGATADGIIEFDSNGHTIAYEFSHVGFLAGFSSVRLVGPLPLGERTGGANVTLCSGCDLTSTPGFVTGPLVRDARIIILNVRKQPYRYYVGFYNVLGAEMARSPLVACGLP